MVISSSQQNTWRSKKYGCTESYFYKTNFWGVKYLYTLSISNTWICKFLWRWVLWYELLFITFQLIKKLKFRPIQYVTKNIQWQIVWSLEFAGNGTEAEIAQAVLVHFCYILFCNTDFDCIHLVQYRSSVYLMKLTNEIPAYRWRFSLRKEWIQVNFVFILYSTVYLIPIG